MGLGDRNAVMPRRCRFCRRPLIWADTDQGRRMPVDAHPVPAGNVMLREQGEGKAPLALVVPFGAFAEGEPEYRSHLDTCKRADQWRVRR